MLNLISDAGSVMLNRVSRRKLFAIGGGSAVAAVIVLAGCSNFASVEQTVGADANLLASGLSTSLASLAALKGIPGLTPDVVAKVQTALGAVQAIAAALQNAGSQAQGQALVQQLETAVNTIVAALTVLPLPPQILLGVDAAAILLPIIETGINLAINAQTQAQASAAATQAQQVTTVTPGAARSVSAVGTPAWARQQLGK